MPLKDHSTIAVDAMGSDLGVEEVVLGVALALEEGLDGRIILVGNEEEVAPLLARHQLDRDDRVEVFHASQVIGMDEKPVQSLKQKKDSSLLKGIELVKEGRADAFVSCGNTGSLMAGATLRLRPLPGVDRPALGSVIPSKDHHFVLIDVGANPESDPRHLVHNAVLGDLYARNALGIENPRIGLLTIGTEEGKGTETVHEAHLLLKGCGELLNYQGLIEGFQVFQNQVDVVVCDGFVGNIVLKTCEGLYQTLKDLVKTEIKRNPLRMLGAFLSQGAFKSMKARLDPDRYAGAPLLGVRGTVLKSHGSSNRRAIASAVRTASRAVRRDITQQIESRIAQANELIRGGREEAAS